jgi:membrane-associated phospholipid phosphatase
MILATFPQPWLPEWNRLWLEKLFLLLPHSQTGVSIAQFLLLDSLVSTWIFAAAFYVFWQVEGERRLWRRTRLVEIALACMLAVAVTLALRPWVGWPAPARAAGFQQLYPKDLWGTGSSNSFPSHSTLVYFIVALGVWPLRRWVSVMLMAVVFFAISLPRVYVGGHYPVDVVAALALGPAALEFLRRICRLPRIARFIERAIESGWLSQLVLFLWVFELGEGFAGSIRIAHGLIKLARHWGG